MGLDKDNRRPHFIQ